ncbi:hypothetical protein [Curtobacterium sp. VKM Ac-1376]|uniref:hypothetical protein n=1 Tax=Curtobacterium sp. VKM Ac-1376 TaxID=123312 RepID=UPI00188D340A|nr:hypothetical protein [Curtobacterium sp. VKM Ac-1376]MBF4616201.1 hypothetical protein [Curtobacterium sp. VKM Ac-1376]
MSTSTTPPRAFIDSGTRPYLRLAGVVGADPVVFTEADLRGPDGGGYRDFLRDARRHSNVDVVETGFGNTDKTFAVSLRVPSLTSVTQRPSKTQTVPPKAKTKRKRRGA